MRISDWSSDVCSSDLGGAGAPVTDTTIEGIGTATTFTRIAGPIKVTVGTSGEVELAMQASYRVTGGDEFISIRADAKLRSSADGSTSWTDVAGSNAAVVDGWAYLNITPPQGWREQLGRAPTREKGCSYM